MTYFNKTECRTPLVTNDQSVDETNNPYLKNYFSPSVAEDEAESVLV